MTATLHQFPTRYHTPIHCIRDGVPWWAYKAEYEYDGTIEVFYFWARSDDDAKDRLAALGAGAQLVGRLQDIMLEAGELNPPPAKR